MAIRPCPAAGARGSQGSSSSVTGLARWQCDAATGEWVPAHGPDLGDCKSAELTRLEVAARSEDPGMDMRDLMDRDVFTVLVSIRSNNHTIMPDG